MNRDSISHLLDECKTIDENCLYTAQTHFVMTQTAQKKVWRLVFWPSLLAVLTGGITAFGGPDWWGAIGAIAAGLAGLATVLGADRDVVAHSAAGGLMTSMRHEARALHETFWKEMSKKELYYEIRRLHDKYNNLRLALGPTDNAAFEVARKRIKEGIFEPDFRQHSNQT